MANTRDLLVRILGDSSGAQGAIKSVSREFGGLGALGKAADGALTTVYTSLGKLGAPGRAAADGIKSVVTGIGNIGPVAIAASAGAIALGGALVEGAAKGVGAFEELAGQVLQFQRVTGTSAEDASKLSGAMRELGVDTDVGQKAFFMLAKNAENTPAKLAAVGIEIARNKNGGVDLYGTLENLATAYQHAGEGAAGDAISFAAFGRSAQDLLPLLTSSKEQLDAIKNSLAAKGLVFDQDALNKAHEFGITMRGLGDSVKGVEIGLGEAVVPALTRGAQFLERMIDDAHQLASIKINIPGLPKDNALNNPFGLIGPTLKNLNPLPVILGAIDAAQNKAGTSAADLKAREDEVGAAFQDAQRQAVAEAAALDKLEVAQVSLVDSTLGVLGAEDSLRRSQQDLQAKQVALTAAVREHGPASKEATQAALDYGDAEHQLESQASATAHAIADQKEQQALANGQTFDAEQKTAAYKQALLDVASGIGGPVGAALASLASQIRDLPAAKTIAINAQDNVTPTLEQIRANMNAFGFASIGGKIYYGGNPAPTGPGHAAGGPTKAGVAYPVGENGPEWFIAGQDGTIIPNGGGSTPKGWSPGSSSSPVVIQMTANFPNYVGSEDDLMTLLNSWANGQGREVLMSSIRGDLRRNGQTSLR